MYDRFKELCEKHGKSMKEVCDVIGIKPSAVSNWKKRGSLPNGDTCLKISKYFGVSMEYLMTGKDWEWEAATPEEIEAFEKLTHPLPSTPIQSVPLTDQERELVGMIRDMNREGREKLLSLAKDLSQLYKKDGGQAQTA